MRILVFGATGMVGQGAVHVALRDPDVSAVVTVGRRATGEPHPKLREIVVGDLGQLSSVAADLTGFDACFFSLGVSAAGMSEGDYARVTYDLTLRVAETLVRLNAHMTFIYVSGAGTDSTEHGRVMWARVKGRTENALLRLPFRAAFMFRPGLIQPLHGIRSRTRLYRAFYIVTAPLLPVVRALFPSQITTTDQIGHAMIAVTANGFPRPILEQRDLARF